MKKIHLTRFAAMATVALLGSTAAWGGASNHEGTGWETVVDGAELLLFSNQAVDLVSISQTEINSYMDAVKTITVRRVDPAAEFSTLMLPVEVEVSEAINGGTGEHVGKVEAAYLPIGYNSVTQTMDFEIQGTIKANKPYLVRVSGSPNVFAFENTSGYSVVATSAAEHSVTLSSSCWEFTGTYANKKWASANNLYGYDANDGVFVKALSAEIYPMRAYLTCTGSGYSNNGLHKSAVEELPEVINVRFLDKNGGTLSIGTMNTRTGDIQMQDRYYDLKGRKLNGKPQNKIMYVNKKVIKH